MISILKEQGVNIESLKNSIYQKKNRYNAYKSFKSCYYKHFIKKSSKVLTKFLGNMSHWN